MNKRNYQLELDRILSGLEGGEPPRLLLHSCCAPCSSYVLEYLSRYFSITVYYYNPNIYPVQEYARRVEEQERLASRMTFANPVRVIAGAYDPEDFYQVVRGLEREPEGGERCGKCFELRLREAAKVAAAGHYDYFTTTLSISPLKNAPLLNEIGERLAGEFGVAYLPSDFKKRGGYQRSIELSKQYELYRQDYCGCVFSVRTPVLASDSVLDSDPDLASDSAVIHPPLT